MEPTVPAVLQPVVSVLAVSTGRVVATLSSLTGLAAVVLCGLALARATGGTRADVDGVRRRSGIGIALGLVVIVVGVLVATTADGGLGTGNGRGGAIVAAALGLLATIVGALARVRSRVASSSA